MASQNQRGRLIFVIGCPGAGKGTLCSRLALHFKWAHISVGDELRKLVRSKLPEVDVISRYVESNELLPVEMLAPVIMDRLQVLEQQGWTTFMLDGFPRHAGQISYMQDKIGTPNTVILMQCPEEVARERVLSRKLQDRKDTETIFEKRFAEFEVNSPSIVERYTSESCLIVVDTSGIEDVSFARLLEALK